MLFDGNGDARDDVPNRDDADDEATYQNSIRDRRRHTVMIGSIVSSQLLLLLATPSSSICIPDFLESAIQVSCTYARQLQLKPFLPSENARVAAWVQEQQLNPSLLDPRRNRCQE